MMKSLGKGWVIGVLTILAPSVGRGFESDRQAEDAPPRFLEQNWSASEREKFYFTPQGSQLIPYDWFLALERKEGGGLFRDDANLDRLRFLTHKKSELNPDGLPVGFVKDSDVDPTRSAAKRLFLEANFGKRARTTEKSWLGMTCAACHTGRVTSGDVTLQIDGAPAMADFQTFLSELADALEATHRDEARMGRFANALGSESPGTLKEEVASHAQALTALVQRNRSESPYGFARLDAFGAILNAVCDAALEIPANRFEPNAPVSFPFLWDTPQMDWVQWNASANVALVRNVGEVLGVFGYFSLKPDGARPQFESTVRLKSLIALEDQLRTLKAPAWPEDVLGRLDRVKVREGRALFAQNCASCHQVRDASGKFQTVDMAGETRIKTHPTPFRKVKTDPQMILNLAHKVDPGPLRSFLPDEMAGLEKVPRVELLKIAVKGVTASRAKTEGVPLTPDPASAIPAPHGGTGYASRALEGIWATAPYLHNGSVPNLYELLLPASKRVKRFFVGSRRFDAKHVGFQTDEEPGAFAFEVANERGPIVGNANVGHEGHGDAEDQGYTQTFEDGAWRDFTEEERYALVEYMKALGHPAAVDEPAEAPMELIPEGEAAQIDHIVALTIQQLKNRYPAQKRVARAVHAKDHGCVSATFEILPDLPQEYRVGVFAEPGRRYDAWVRFSNAATLVLPDDTIGKDGKPAPGSRGMAIKLMGVEGDPLLPPFGAVTQDFLMVNHPVFAFANVEDYEVLSEVIADPANKEDAENFFKRRIAQGGAARERALKTLAIVGRIRARTVAEGAFQPQPASPVDSRYFSAAPFRFGEGHVMKFSAVPLDAPADPKPNVADPNYLRNALIDRLAVREDARPVVFEFKVQRRPAAGLDLAVDVEDASAEWPESRFPFVTVAKLTIPPQDFDSPERRALCEALFFTPWHGLESHRPLGGINRMRKAVYEASSGFRHQPKEPVSRERD
ncbi:MAG: di-heme-cytochrome C peroxidase [Isosphaeraceae bacterium]